MSSFFAPRGAPHHSETPRHPASARVLSLSLLLGLSPLAGITPAALAAPDQQAPASPAQQADTQQASRQQAALQAAPVQNAPVQGNKQDASLPTLRVSSGSLDILHGGTVHVEGTGLSPEFLAHHELRSLTIAPKGSSTYANPYQKVDHRGLVFDAPKPATDGSFSADLTVPANSLPANLEYEVILTYAPSMMRTPMRGTLRTASVRRYRWSSTSQRLSFPPSLMMFRLFLRSRLLRVSRLR